MLAALVLPGVLTYLRPPWSFMLLYSREWRWPFQQVLLWILVWHAAVCQINIVIIKGHSAKYHHDFRLAQQYSSTSMRLSADVNGIKST
jgi:hypothetical protein